MMKRWFKTRKSRNIFQLVAGLVLIILINFVAGFKFKRFDLTAEKRYSLSDTTKSILSTLDDRMLVTVYLEGKDLPIGFKRLKNATQEILEEFRFYAKGNFEYRFIDPFAGVDDETKKGMYRELTEKGLVPTDIMESSLQGRKVNQIFPGAIVGFGGREVPVQLLEGQFKQGSEIVLNQSIERLEYNFSKAFYKAIRYQKKKQVVFSRGHNEMFELNLADMVTNLREFYEVNAVNIGHDLNALNGDIACLIIAKPDTVFDDASKFIIDQYIMRGGRVLWLLDNVFSSNDSLGTRDYTVAFPKDLGLYDQLFKYGVRINPTVIQDAECAQIVIDYGNFGTQQNEGLFPWYYYPVITPDGKHPIVKNINSLKLEFANSMDTIKSAGIKKTVLLHTSNMTKVQYAPVRVSLNVIEQKPTPETFTKDSVPVAVLLEGEFPSIFANRIVELGNTKALDKSKPTKMIVVSDGDIIKNSYNRKTEETAPLGLDTKTGIYYSGNKTFILNSVNYLTDDTWFIPLRSKEFRIRLLDKNKLTASKNRWKMINTGAPVIMIILFGLIYNQIRKRRFA